MTNVVLTADMILTRTRAQSLNDVKKLNYWASNLNDISILRKTPNIEILTLSVNKITTLKDLENCNNLSELYIRNNNISDINDVNYLKNNKKLKILWLADNPCALEKNYRLIVLKVLPLLIKLDNAVVTSDEIEESKKLEYEFKIENNFNDSLLKTDDVLITTDLDTNFQNELKNLINNFNDKLDATNDSLDIETTKNENDKTSDNVALAIENVNILDESVVDDNFLTNNVDLKTNEINKTIKSSNLTRMSYEETNKLRLELGLKPLPEPNIPVNNTPLKQSPNVIAAVLSLVKDLNTEGLDMVISACQYRKELLKNIIYET